MSTHVYFIRPIGMGGPVKIGCSKVPEQRLAYYLALAPWPLEVAVKIPGDYRLEAQFHQLLVAHHSHHEWFHDAPAVRAVIDELLANRFDFARLPAPKRLPCKGGRKWSEQTRTKLRISIGLRRVAKLGVEIPDDIEWAQARWTYGRYWKHYDPALECRPEDAERIFQFIERVAA